MNICENIEIIREKIKCAEKKSGRKDGCVKLMAVSKFHPGQAVIEAISSNQFLFGENRVQEASEKFISIREQYPQIQLHLIGQLQSNKVKKAVKIADCIQSIDRIDLLKEIEKECSKINKKIDVLLELHTGEESKSGFESEASLISALEQISDGFYPHINPKGLMTMAPFSNDEKLIRKSFITLRNLSEKLKENFPDFDLSELSMGMSGDFEIAIEEGSTLVRVGTAIFGERDYSR